MILYFALTLAALHAEPRATEMLFTKGAAPAYRLHITRGGRASISRGHHVLVEGQLVGEESSFRIETPEGDVCPSVSIEYVYLVEKPGEVGAEVAVDLSSVDAQARRACAGLAEVGGSYARIVSK